MGLMRWRRVALVYAVFFCGSLLTTIPWVSSVGGWLDEGATMSAAQRTPAGILALSRHHDAVLGTYYAVVHSWMEIAGTSLASARVLSAVCVAAATVMVVDCGRVIGGMGAGCVAGVQMLIVPGVGWSGFDARPTAVSVLLVTVALRLLLQARGTVPSGWFYAVIAVAGWVQLTSILQLAVAVRRSTMRSARLWVSTLAVGLVVVPVAWKGHQQAGQISWIHDGLAQQLVSVFVGRFADAPKSTTYLTQSVSVTSAILGVAYAGLCLAGLATVRSPVARLLAHWTFTPALLAVVAGALTQNSGYLPRYFAASLPAGFLLVALLTTTVWPRNRQARITVAVSALLISGLCAPSLVASRVADGKWGEDSRNIVRTVAVAGAPVVWMDNSLSIPLTYPQMTRHTRQYPNPSGALNAESLWGATPNARAAVELAKHDKRVVVVARSRATSEDQRAFRAAGCTTRDTRQHQRYTLFMATCK